MKNSRLFICQKAAVVFAVIFIFVTKPCHGQGKNPYDEMDEEETRQKSETGKSSLPVKIKSDEATKREKSAELHFNRGVEYFKEELFEAALSEFLLSYRTMPKWQILYNIGVSYYKTGRYDEAIEAFDEYLKKGGKNIPEERRITVNELRLRMASTYGSIVIDYGLPGVRITIDGRKTFTTPVKEPIAVSAGQHTIFMFREGHYPVLKEVFVASGEQVKVSVKMEMTPLMEAWLTETGKAYNPAFEERVKNLKTTYISLYSVALTLAIGGIIAGGVTYDLKEKQDHEIFKCGSIYSQQDCPEAFKLKDKGEKWKLATNSLLISSGVIAMVASCLWLWRKVLVKRKQDELEVSLGLTQGRGVLNW